MILAIISKLFAIVKFTNINNPSSYVMNLAWIVVFIAIIKGFLNKSNIARQLAIGLAVIGLIATGVGLFFIMTVPFLGEGEMKMALSLSIVAFMTELFTIFALSSDTVINHFVAHKNLSAQHKLARDRGKERRSP